MPAAEPFYEVRSPWNPWLRAGTSLLIAFHLLGVMVAPMTVPPRFEGPPAVIGSKLKQVYGPYMTALYLDHAYKFFAPNPGDSHLLRYDLYFADGTKRINQDDQIFPDRFNHWPRLLYHRHFMLTEFINDFAPPEVWRGVIPPGMNVPPGAAAGLPGNAPNLAVPPTPVNVPAVAGPHQPDEFIPFTPQPERPGPPYVHEYVDGIARYLAKRHGATRVDLYYRKHLLPTSEDYRRVGGRLDSPESYLDRLITSYTVEQKL